MTGLALLAAVVLETSRNGIDLKIESDRTSIDPGRSVFLSVEIKTPAGTAAVQPDLRSRARGFSLAEEYTADPVENGDGSKTTVSNWRLVPEPCAASYKIAPFEVKAAAGDQPSKMKDLSFVAGPVKFDPPPSRNAVEGGIETDPEKDMPPLSWALAGWCLAALAAAAAVVFALYAALRYFSRRVKEHFMSPIERARAELSRLVGRGLPARGRFKDFYIELTMVVRRYVQRKYGIKAPHLTTEEFFEETKNTPEFPQNAVDGLVDFLGKADMVKFAGVEATPETADAATDAARTYLETDSKETEKWHSHSRTR